MAHCPFKRMVCMLILFAATLSYAAAPESIDIPYKKFVLDNGLTVIIHEDHKAPIVAVNTWYHVGSKNEKPGKTGFAHLFEHLMFNGSEHFKADHFEALEKVGATDLNGTTAEDRTNYFQNVPTTAFDVVLWLESDRMGHMLPAIDQLKLDTQRGVVQNEKRQGQNRPYGKCNEQMYKSCFPAGHPYSWEVIGSMEDLDAAKLPDVHEWFRTYYGPSNAVLSIAGDVDTSAALARVKFYFDSIPPGPPVARYSAWVAKRSGTIRQLMQDRVPQTRIVMVWNVPQWGSQEAALLDVAADALSTGKSSRLVKRLVQTDQTATRVSAYNDSMEIAGLFVIEAFVRPGVDPARVEQAINEEMAKFLDDGPTADEMARARMGMRSSLIRGLERIGGFGGRSDRLAEGQTYAGDPEAYKTYLDRIAQATPKQVRAAARQWLSDGVYIQQVDPFPKMKNSKEDVDRTTMPLTAMPPDAQFPKLQRATLSNGMKVILAERRTVPVINFNIMFDGGTAADPADLPGLTRTVMGMFLEGTQSRSAEELSDEMQMLGAQLAATYEKDYVSVSLSALAEKLDPSLDLYADIILNPAFRPDDFEKLRQRTLAGLQQTKASPTETGARVLPRLVFGERHPYGALMSEESVRKITPEDLVIYHSAWFKPGNATMIVVGATSLGEIVPKLEKAFNGWQGGDSPTPRVEPITPIDSPVIYLIDKPQAEQSYIMAATVAPPKNNPEEVALETMNMILGGTFTSRINMNLREEKHWTYGARTGFSYARGQRIFIASTSVQSDKTREAMAEILSEMKAIRDARPVSTSEFDKARGNKQLRLPGTWATIGDVAGSISIALNCGLPDDYYQNYPAMVRDVTIERVENAAREVVQPGRMTWLVLGDRAKIEQPLRELEQKGFGPLRVVDTDGNPAK